MGLEGKTGLDVRAEGHGEEAPGGRVSVLPAEPKCLVASVMGMQARKTRGQRAALGVKGRLRGQVSRGRPTHCVCQYFPSSCRPRRDEGSVTARSQAGW